MNTKSVPLPAPDDLATGRLPAAAESATGGMQERPANLGNNGQDTIVVRRVDNPRDIGKLAAER